MSNSTSPANLPSFIDTASCLCGLLESQSSLPNNGGIVQMWRCIGDASEDIISGGHGKWFNTTLPSQERSGINRPPNWGDNPPNSSVAYVLEGQDGNVAYVELGSGGSPSLIGTDADCTSRNDTEKSALYYSGSRGANGTTSSSASSSSQASSMSSASSMASSMASSASATATSESAMTTSGTATSASTDAASSPSSTSSSPSESTESSSSSSAATHCSLTSALLVSMVFAPLIALTM